MKYTKGTISIATRQGKIEVPALIAGNTGLAYHKYLNQDNTLADNLYVVSHVHTGRALLNADKASEARLAIDTLLDKSKSLVDWQAENPIENMPFEKYQAVGRMIRDIQQ